VRAPQKFGSPNFHQISASPLSSRSSKIKDLHAATILIFQISANFYLAEMSDINSLRAKKFGNRFFQKTLSPPNLTLCSSLRRRDGPTGHGQAFASRPHQRRTISQDATEILECPESVSAK
jgi:hypothetical protein